MAGVKCKIMEYDYRKIIKEGSSDVTSVKGRRLDSALAHVVADEINVVHLCFDGIWYSVHGLVGSEVMGFKRRERQFQAEIINEGSVVCRLPILDQFVGLEVAEVRHIGEAWNGHGFELSFKGVPDKTLILQSIYTGSEPEEFSDCMRIGVGNYIYQVPTST
tara:strand:+ start:3363 stop:3848 length:486 start_codon:yes stop_codon:yes gene_type:complete